MKILYIQYAGDFSEVYQTLYVNNGKENYYGQKYSIGVVVDQARSGHQALVVTIKSDRYKNVKLEDNLQSIELNIQGYSFHKSVENIIIDFAPDCIVLRAVDIKVLKFIRKNNIPVLLTLADSFEIKETGIRFFVKKFRQFMLSREFQHSSIRWIANHQINACKALQKLGVSPSKILPYDWEHDDSPANWQKPIPIDFESKKIQLFYAGMLIEKKGILDLIASVALIKNMGRTIQLRIAGKATDDKCQILVKQLHLDDCVEFLGIIDHDQVLAFMNSSDFVVVPSHHSYPEGLPMTIMESLMVHTPVIASNHPMFVGRVGKKGAVQFFPEKDVDFLAKLIISSASSFEDYKNRCNQTSDEWKDICLDLKWGDLVNRWLSDPEHCDFSASALDKYLD